MRAASGDGETAAVGGLAPAPRGWWRRSRARRVSVCCCGALRRREGRVVAEDRLLQPLQRLARIDAEVVDERPPRLGVCVERLGLPVGAVEGEHLLRAEPFAQRVLTHEQIQLAEGLFVAAEREVAVDPLDQRRQPQLVELRHLVASQATRAVSRRASGRARARVPPGSSSAAALGLAVWIRSRAPARPGFACGWRRACRVVHAADSRPRPSRSGRDRCAPSALRSFER